MSIFSHRIFWPPRLLASQFAGILLFSHLSGWKNLGRWFFHNSIPSLPIAAGARGMGCIGFPDHPVWEVTAQCNLNCLHCHVSAGEAAGKELTTEEGKRLLRELRRVSSFRMIVFSGGEPLVRKDIFELLSYAKQIGFFNVIATNGMLITEDVAREMKKRGVAGVAVSVDSAQESVHNKIRNCNVAYEKAVDGIRHLKSAGIPVQINVTAMEYNFSGLEGLLDFAQDMGAVIVLMYQLVPVGRGGNISSATLDTAQNGRLLEFIRRKQRDISCIVEPVAGPQYWPYLLTSGPRRSRYAHFLARKVFHGCSAGRGFVYIKADGQVWPCPFIDISAGNIRDSDFISIWEKAEVFRDLRRREELLKGKCGSCRFKGICGGCRGRAMAFHGDLMAEDPSCFIEASARES